MVGATSLDAKRISGIFDPPAVAKEALREGAAVRLDKATVGRENHDIKLPLGSGADEFLAGVNKEGGGPLTSTTENPDPINIQSLGLAKCWLLRNNAAKPGETVDANSAGYVKPRTRWGASGPALGFFYQDRASASEEIPVEVQLMPHMVEIVMPITGGSDGNTIGAATKYLAAPGVGHAASQVPLFACRHAMTLRYLGASLLTAPGGGDTVIFTVQKSSDNGATWTDTTLTCTISAAAKSAQDLDPTHAVSLAAGDLVAIKVVSSAGTAAGPLATVSAT